MKSRCCYILFPAFIMLVFCGCKSNSIQSETPQPVENVELYSQAQNDKEKLLDMALRMSGKKLNPEERSSALRILNLNEGDLINGLTIFSELFDGRYPSKLDTKTTLEEAEELGSEKLRDMPEHKRKQNVQDIFFASAYYGKLQRDKKDVAYYGDIVTAKDKDRILIRWKIEKNEYRVVFGDLRTEDVSVERLYELET